MSFEGKGGWVMVAQAQGERRRNQKNVGLFVTVGCPVEFTRQKLVGDRRGQQGGRKRRLNKKVAGAPVNGCGWKRSNCTIDRFAVEAAN